MFHPDPAILAQAWTLLPALLQSDPRLFPMTAAPGLGFGLPSGFPPSYTQPCLPFAGFGDVPVPQSAPVTVRCEKQEENVAAAVKDKQEPGLPVPSWVPVLLKSSFFVPCEAHRSLKKNEATFFCTTCAARPVGLCQHCVCHHQGHQVIQIRRYVYCDVVRAVDIQPYIDTAGVQSYIINQAKVVFLNCRPQSKQGKPGDPDTCRTCARHLREGAVYCSLACKVAALQAGDTWAPPAESASEEEGKQQGAPAGGAGGSAAGTSDPTTPGAEAASTSAPSPRRRSSTLGSAATAAHLVGTPDVAAAAIQTASSSCSDSFDQVRRDSTAGTTAGSGDGGGVTTDDERSIPRPGTQGMRRPRSRPPAPCPALLTQLLSVGSSSEGEPEDPTPAAKRICTRPDEETAGAVAALLGQTSIPCNNGCSSGGSDSEETCHAALATGPDGTLVIATTSSGVFKQLGQQGGRRKQMSPRQAPTA